MDTTAVERFRGYPVKCRRAEVAGRVLEVLGPTDYEGLLDDPEVIARFEQDEYLPYWAEFWPAALVLADAVAVWDPGEADRGHLRLLELGCGLGVVSLVALQRGYAVTASDYDEDALAFVAESARRNSFSNLVTRHIDWRESYPDLRFDRIVAAEVLYEARSLRPIAEFISRHLSPQGLALICDANRPTADGFPQVAGQVGLTVEQQAHARPDDLGNPAVRARLFRVRHQAG
jgi:2-polyprenyl-3-methyl-5-hydroxy-6-metoxy-1,4-benzoquinol methylase